jgi:hypothetical protein
MAGIALLQVNDFTLAGIDTTLRKTVVEGTVITLAGSLATIAIAAAGTGYATGDQFTIAGGINGIGTVTAQTGGVPSAVSIANSGRNYGAVTGAATTAISPSVGSGLTVTTTVTANGGQIVNITGWAIVSNVLTFTANNSFTTGGGQTIVVYGFTGAQVSLNGSYTTTSATATTIVVAKTAANGSGSQAAIAVLDETYVQGGIPLSYAFIDQLGNARTIGTIGPIVKPFWIEVMSTIGGATGTTTALTYLVNTSVTPNLLKVYQGASELAAGALPYDALIFRAEFTKNGF